MQRIAKGIAALGAAAVAAATLAAVGPTGGAARAEIPLGSPGEYVAVYAGTGTSAAAAGRRAIEAAGGTVLAQNPALGTALVHTPRAGFLDAVLASDAVHAATLNRPIGMAPTPLRSLVERLPEADRAAAAARLAAHGTRLAQDREFATVGDEPLAELQWNMAMIDATASGSHDAEPGDPRVRVGIIDTGVDASHPDLAPNMDTPLSRNFVTDIPDVDGPCEATDCRDGADVDDNGHGTHVAGIIGAARNGLGIAGVAPEVRLVNVRAGQDSGYFFLQPVLDALTYSADVGLDVVNMSFYVDPWLYNCSDNPADSAEDQLQQQATVTALQRAVDYARGHGVTVIGALGNEGTDLGQPSTDDTSPNFPDDRAYERSIDNSCLTVPAETDGVVAVAALGPSGRKAYYSNYGVEQTDVSAPGGDAFDTPDFEVDPAGLILSAYPEALARALGDVDDQGEPTSPFTVRDCLGDVCAYYQYLQGTSMAAPHVAGVAALAVSRFGLASAGGFGLDPDLTEAIVLGTATRQNCPAPADYPYTVHASSGTRQFVHSCENRPGGNGFYGRGLVDANAVAGLPALSDLGTPGGTEAPPPATPTEPTPSEPTPSEPTPSEPTPSEPAAPDAPDIDDPAPVDDAEPTPPPGG